MTDTLEELERLLAAATPGPWKHISGKRMVFVVAPECHVYSNRDADDGEGPHHPNTIKRWNADAALIVAAINALPELLALRKENERLRETLEKLTDCQQLPKVYKYTGTAEVDVENMFDVGHRHKSGKQPRDYLMSWLSMFRPFAYATKDDSWGELEKLISITMNNYVQMLAKAEAARAALKGKSND